MFNGFPKREGRYEISHNLNRGDFHSRVTRGVTLREVRESSGSAVPQVTTRHATSALTAVRPI